ncbi:hypothetical protein GCM10023153_03960 [Ornithinibacter aureus]|uniref:Uncharacterized protein n=1 Tax=Ornithinibacter aureus TaxID=622664 RepID=A0ABP8JCC3_9MICO
MRTFRAVPAPGKSEVTAAAYERRPQVLTAGFRPGPPGSSVGGRRGNLFACGALAPAAMSEEAMWPDARWM